MSLKKFEILEMVARGGMAEVFRARTIGSRGMVREVCIKKIRAELLRDPNMVAMFIDEAKLAATLSHSNIVQVYDLGVSEDGRYFIVMEYVHGKDLAEIIRKTYEDGGALPIGFAVFVARHACRALHHAHTRTDAAGSNLQLIHRDVSPHNVLLSFDGQVKLTDFGIAKASTTANRTAAGILKGKYGYMSPEQARGRPLDHRTDIFNLGIVMYEMLVGERCFAGSSDFSTLCLMQEAQATPPSSIKKDIPKRLEVIVMKALARDPKDRFQTAREMEEALDVFAEIGRVMYSERDAANLMRALWSNPESERRTDRATSVLSLASMVVPTVVDHVD